MLYKDYVKKKTNKAIKFGYGNGNPCIARNTTGDSLLDYKIYGNSTQETKVSKNLLQYPYVETTKTENGITFTDNGDGTITVDGTATSVVDFILCGNLVLDTGTYVISGCEGCNFDIQDGEGLYYVENGKNVYIMNNTFPIYIILTISSGTTFSNVVLRPQLEKGTTPTDYEQYSVMPSPDFPSEIQSVGDLTIKNLIPYPYVETTQIKSGITFTDNGDGSITVNGTATANVTWYFYRNEQSLINGLKIGDTITVSIDCDKTWVQSPATMNIVCNYYNSETTMKDGGCIVNSTTKYKTITIGDDWVGIGMYVVVYSGQTIDNITLKPQVEIGSTATEYEPYHKYDIPIIVRGKNVLPNSDWMSGQHSDGFTQSSTAKYITGYTQNSISFNLTAWTGVSSPRFSKDSVKRIVFKINQNALNSDSYANFYISIQGYDDDNNKVGNRLIYDSVVADTGYVFDFSTIASYSFYGKSTQFSFCILARKNALSNLMVYDIAYYADTDITEYEPYIGEKKHIYLDEPLRKVGDYADYIDFKNQKVVRNVTESIFNGTESWVKTSNTLSGAYQGFAISNSAYNIPSGTNLICFSDKFLYSSTVKKNIIKMENNSTFTLRIIIGIEYVSDLELETFKTWLSENNIKVVYPIETSVEESIILPELSTVENLSIYVVESDVSASNIIVQYKRR